MKTDGKRFWPVPRLWPDRTVFILGGGPSLAGVDVERLRGQRVIAVNNAFKLGRWIDVMYFGDCRWLKWHKEELAKWPGLKVTTCDQHLSNLGLDLNIKVVHKKASQTGLFRDPTTLAWNLSSGACAINLATHFGAKRIILLGYDMRKVDDRCNWHVEHPNAEKHNPYEKFMGRFPAIAQDLSLMGVECVNATPGSALRVFPIVDPETVMP